jgi:hypothetical protein
LRLDFTFAILIPYGSGAVMAGTRKRRKKKPPSIMYLGEERRGGQQDWRKQGLKGDREPT